MGAGQARDDSRDRARPAVRPGSEDNAWDMPPDVWNRLNRLRDAVHNTLHTEFASAVGDLQQLRGLLGDAAQKLAEAFCEMTANSSTLLALLDGEANGGGSEPPPEAAEIARAMCAKTGMTVQNLQFEDMATQLLQHINKRLGMLESFSKEMAVLYPDPNGGGAPLTHEALDRLFLVLEERRVSLATVGRKVVQQSSMDSGVVELF